jgi:hypothetical protein
MAQPAKPFASKAQWKLFAANPDDELIGLAVDGMAQRTLVFGSMLSNGEAWMF